ncbi:MAG TPA: 50S ribosomal protein L31e [Candidatus Bathyarchaeota archaeon]|nr:MAG: 50S ribosomal protein L31e [Candidatus Bathyarchaeota archaeon]HDJ26673.1 50S ribosomal protein L31e [Candidatus Bathyarchaeota archaeon]
MSAPEEEEPIEVRTYVVPLGRTRVASRKKRAPRAIRLIKEFARRHMKAEEVKIAPELNEFIWSRGIEKPPRRVRVRMEKYEDGLVKVYLAEEGQ